VTWRRGRARRLRAPRRRQRMPRRSRWRGLRRRRDAGSWMRSYCLASGTTLATLTTPGAPWYVHPASVPGRQCWCPPRHTRAIHSGALLGDCSDLRSPATPVPHRDGYRHTCAMALSPLPPPALTPGAEGPGGGGAVVLYGGGAALRGGALWPGPDLPGRVSAGVRCAAGET
jgi:hypothetical protein